MLKDNIFSLRLVSTVLTLRLAIMGLVFVFGITMGWIWSCLWVGNTWSALGLFFDFGVVNYGFGTHLHFWVYGSQQMVWDSSPFFGFISNIFVLGLAMMGLAFLFIFWHRVCTFLALYNWTLSWHQPGLTFVNKTSSFKNRTGHTKRPSSRLGSCDN